MHVTGKTSSGKENQLSVEIFNIETVKTEIVQSIKNNDTLGLIDKVVDLYGVFSVWRGDCWNLSNTQQANSGPVGQIAPGLRSPVPP